MPYKENKGDKNETSEKNKTSKEIGSVDDWFKNTCSAVQTWDENKTSEQLQHDGYKSGDGDRTRRERRPRETDRSSNGTSKQKTRRLRKNKSNRVDENIEIKSRKINTYYYTMEDLSNSLSDEVLLELIRDKFDPNKTIGITKTKKEVVDTSKFSEDKFIDNSSGIKIKKIKKIKKAIPLPSLRYKKDLDACKDKGEINSKAILGLYFELYKIGTGEEDPEWIGVSSLKAEHLIDEFVSTTACDKYEEVLHFTKVIVPRYIRRVVAGKKFPNSLPTVEILYGKGKKYFWKNKKWLAKEWIKEEKEDE